MKSSRIAVTGEELPPAGCRRWTPHRKLAVVAALKRGAIGRTEARHRWQLSEEELQQWLDGVARNGVVALYITKGHP